jgi:hypothetical protein
VDSNGAGLQRRGAVGENAVFPPHSPAFPRPRVALRFRLAMRSCAACRDRTGSAWPDRRARCRRPSPLPRQRRQAPVRPPPLPSRPSCPPLSGSSS